jgi:hypothetical protein
VAELDVVYQKKTEGKLEGVTVGLTEALASLS